MERERERARENGREKESEREAESRLENHQGSWGVRQSDNARIEALGGTLLHARPFVGVFKSQFQEAFSIFGDKCPQDGSKNDQMVPRTALGCHHEGPLVAYLLLRALSLLLASGDGTT